MKLSELIPDRENANRGTDRGRRMVFESVRDLGAARSLLVDKNFNVIAGNKTLEAGLILDMDMIIIQTEGKQVVVVQRTDMELSTDNRAKLLAIVDNRASEVGLDWDPQAIANMQGRFPLADMWKPKELEALLKPLRGSITATDDVEPAPDEPRTLAGDLYIMGNHRLLCGDSTNLADVATLMNGELGDLCWMDPPYNVAYTGGTGMTIQNDDQTDVDFAAMLASAMLASAQSLRPGAMSYVAHSDSYGHAFRRAAQRAGFEYIVCLEWIKSAFVMGHSDYHWQHEPILYLHKPGAEGLWFGNKKQTTVLEFDRPAKRDVHPTMKPVDLVKFCIMNSSAPGMKVVDLFGGSGTTMMACEELDRVAFLMELDRGYCDVIVNRWETATGRKAELVRE